MSAKAPGAGASVRGTVGKEWTTMEPNSEIKLVRVSDRALSVLAFLGEIGFWPGLFTCVWDSHVRF